MLFLQTREGYRQWSTGKAVAFVGEEHEGHSFTIGVACRIAGMDFRALLDTGAAWSVVDGEIAEAAGSELSDPLEDVVISSRFGTSKGALHRLQLTLPAEEGRDLSVGATVAVLKNWRGPTVLGFRGFLERIQIALQPAIDADVAYIHFAGL